MLNIEKYVNKLWERELELELERKISHNNICRDHIPHSPNVEIAEMPNELWVSNRWCFHSVHNYSKTVQTGRAVHVIAKMNTGVSVLKEVVTEATNCFLLFVQNGQYMHIYGHWIGCVLHLWTEEVERENYWQGKEFLFRVTKIY